MNRQQRQQHLNENLIEAHNRKNHKIPYLEHMLLLMMVHLPLQSPSKPVHCQQQYFLVRSKIVWVKN